MERKVMKYATPRTSRVELFESSWFYTSGASLKKFNSGPARYQPRAPRSTWSPTPSGRGSGNTWRTSRTPQPPHLAAPCTCAHAQEIKKNGELVRGVCKSRWMRTRGEVVFEMM